MKINVMKKAHELTRKFIASKEWVGNYSIILGVALKYVWSEIKSENTNDLFEQFANDYFPCFATELETLVGDEITNLYQLKTWCIGKLKELRDINYMNDYVKINSWTKDKEDEIEVKAKVIQGYLDGVTELSEYVDKISEALENSVDSVFGEMQEYKPFLLEDIKAETKEELLELSKKELKKLDTMDFYRKYMLAYKNFPIQERTQQFATHLLEVKEYIRKYDDIING